MMACDLVVAAEHVKFGLAEVKRGLMPGGGGTLLATRIPLTVALEITLTGETFDAARALELGLVNRVVPAGTEVDEAFALAEAIAANGPLAVRTVKKMVRASTAGRSAVDQSGSATARQGDDAMAWDFETEPEFETKLEWIRQFVREKV